MRFGLQARYLVAASLLVAAAAVCAAPDIGYDSDADPFEQRAAATAQARAENKLVLLISGGDWCIWCHYLNAFLTSNADVDAALHEVFVVEKVYVGDRNYNKEFFATLPEAAGAPHFWVLSRAGDVLESQPTLALEDGAKSYDRGEFMTFIERWRERAAP